jgi:single-strand DNA-binding protein
MNQLTIIGNLTADPTTRTTPSGKSVCSFDLAVNDRKGNTTYFRVSAWEKLGEICQRYLSKGKKVSVIGPVSARAYTDKNGKANVSIEVAANDIEFLSPRDNEVAYQQQERQAIQNEPKMQPVQTEELPF